MSSGSYERTSNSNDPLGTTDRLIGVAIFVAAIFGQLATFDRSIVPMDEGHLATLAMGLQDGKLLYRDLHTGIFPGIYHLTAMLFGIFGNDLIVTRCAEVAVNGSIATCLWLAGAHMMSRGWALVAPLLYISLVPISFPVLAMFNYSSLALGLAMASLVLLLRYLAEGERAVAIALGITLALTVFFKQNFGAFTFVALLLALVVNRRDSALVDRSWGAILLPIASAGIGVTLAFVVYFVATGTLDDFVQATMIQIGGDQMESFNNPIPPILGQHPIADSRFTFLYSPPYLFNKLIHAEALVGSAVDTNYLSHAIRLSYGVPIAVLIFGPVAWFLGARSDNAHTRCGVRTSVTFTSLFFLGIFPSAVWSHLAFVMPPILLLLGLVLSQGDTALCARSRAAATGLRAVAATVTGCALVLAAFASMDVARWHPTPLDLPRASLNVTPHQAAIYQDALAFVNECSPSGEDIFVAPYMPIVYFLTDRGNVSRYDLTIPGNVDGQRIIDSLESAQTRCIVYNPVMYPEFAPFHELFPMLNEYLRQQYGRRRDIRGGNEAWFGLVRKDS